MACGVVLLFLVAFLAGLPVLCWKVIGPQPNDDTRDRFRGFLRFGYAMVGLCSGYWFEWWALEQELTCLAIPMAFGGLILGMFLGDYAGHILRPYIPGDEED